MFLVFLTTYKGSELITYRILSLRDLNHFVQTCVFSYTPLENLKTDGSVIEQNPVFSAFLIPEYSTLWHTDCVSPSTAM